MLDSPEYSIRCALANDYVPLCFRLREGMELHPVEREFIAAYLEGRRQPRGRGASPRKVLRYKRHYRLFWYLTEIEGDQADHAYDRLAEIHRISRRTAIAAVREMIRTGEAGEVERKEHALREAMKKYDEEPGKQKLAREFLDHRRRRVMEGTLEGPDPV